MILEDNERNIQEIKEQPDNQKEGDSQQQNSVPKSQSIDKEKPSQFYESYMNCIGDHLTVQKIKELKQILRDNHVIIDQNYFYQKLQCEILETDFQSFTLLLHYGIYKLKIHILMTEFTDTYFTGQLVSTGSFGSIYSIMVSYNLYAVKRIILGQPFLYEDLLIVYKQYFLCSIASMLKVGPKVQNIFGYDIIVNKNSAFFAMEYCHSFKQQKQQDRVKESIQNMKILHSLKFIHLDIKPDNLAYSFQFKKQIFIDFGLSLLIKNNVGYKTYSHFVGTMAYCSEQMKKTYFLVNAKYIDLYYNDLVSLLNTLKETRYHPDFFQYGQENKISFLSSSSLNRIDLIKQSLPILQLKYHIFLKNISQIEEIFPKLINMPQCFYTVLNNKTFQRLIHKYDIINDSIAIIRRKITQTVEIGNMGDKIISEALQTTNQNQKIYQFKLSQQVLYLPTSKFQTLLLNQNFICNILLYLHDFSKEETKNIQKQKFILKLIKKIIKLKYHGVYLEIYEEMDYFLNFLNMKVEKNRNYKILSILRMLFIRIEDFQSIQSIEDEIISLISNPIRKCLQITQFLLFWSILFDILQYCKLKKWKQIIEKQKGNEEVQVLYIKIKQFSLCLFEIISKRCNEALCRILYLKIQQFLIDPDLEQYQPHIEIIRAMYGQIYRIQKIDFSKNQVLKIYSVYFPSIKFLRIRIQSNSFFDLFQPYAKHLPLYNKLNSKKNEQTLEKLFNYVFTKFEYRPDLISQHLIENLQSNINCKRQIIKFIEKFSYSLQMLSKKFSSFCQFQIYFFLKTILSFFLLIKLNKYYSRSQDDQISENELILLIEIIEHVINLFNQKFDMIIQSNYTRIDIFRINQKIISIKLNCLKKQFNSVQRDVSQAFSSIKSMTVKEDRALLLYCQMLQQLMHRLPKNKQQFFEELILEFCESQIELQQFFIFQKRIYTVYHYFRINSKRNKQQKNRKLIEHLIRYIQQNDAKFQPKYLPQNSFSFFCQTFCSLTSKSELKIIYQQICFSKKQFQSKCFPFYVLCIFEELYRKKNCLRGQKQKYQLIQMQIILRQLKRSCLCLEKMFSLHALYARRTILSLSRVHMIQKSKRKQIVLERMLLRTSFLQKLIKWDLRVLKSQVKRIENIRIKQMLLKQKIFRSRF